MMKCFYYLKQPIMCSLIFLQKYEPVDVKCLIIDFSALSYIDPSGCTALKMLIRELNNISIVVYIAACSCWFDLFGIRANSLQYFLYSLGPAYEMMRKCDLKDQGNGEFKFYPTVHDAVHNATEVTAPISIITERL